MIEYWKEVIGFGAVSLTAILLIASLSEDTWSTTSTDSSSTILGDCEYGLTGLRGAIDISYEDCIDLSGLDFCKTVKQAGETVLGMMIISLLFVALSILLLLLTAFCSEQVPYTKPAMFSMIFATIPMGVSVIVWAEDGHNQLEANDIQSKEYGTSFETLVAAIVLSILSIVLLRYGLKYSKPLAYQTIGSR